MVINNSPKKEEPKDRQSVRENMLRELEKQPDAILTLAFMYARGYDLGGEDITKAWTNAIRNNQILETAYKRGYDDCLKDAEQNRIRDFYHKVIVDKKK